MNTSKSKQIKSLKAKRHFKAENKFEKSIIKEGQTPYQEAKNVDELKW